MSFSDRDYVRQSGGSAVSNLNICQKIIIVTAIVYLIQMVVPGFSEWFSLDPQAVLRGQVWRLFTFDFLHSEVSPWHIMLNMYLLYLTGSKILGVMSEREFLLFYLTAGVMSGCAFLLWQLYLSSANPAIGASGSVAAVMTLYAIRWPRDTWLFMMIIPVPVIAILLIMTVLDLHPVLIELRTRQPYDNVAHMAHLGGMLFAFLYWRRSWQLEPLAGGLSLASLRKKFRRRPNLKVHRPSEVEQDSIADLQTRMDELLQKISDQGEASLTDAERETLNQISRRLRTRRGL